MEVKKTTVEKVRELAQPIADELGFFLWDVRFERREQRGTSGCLSTRTAA